MRILSSLYLTLVPSLPHAQDMIKFGFSSREYVLLHEDSRDSDDDDDDDNE